MMKSLTKHVPSQMRPGYTMCGEAIDHGVEHLVDDNRRCHYCRIASIPVRSTYHAAHPRFSLAELDRQIAEITNPKGSKR